MLSMTLIWSFGKGTRTCGFNTPLILFTVRGLSDARFVSHLLSGTKYSLVMENSVRVNEYN